MGTNKEKEFVVQLSPGQMIFQEGDEADFFYLIRKDGQVVETKKSPTGDIVVIKTRKEGDVLGVIPFSFDIKAKKKFQHHTTAVSCAGGSLMKIPFSKLEKMAREEPTILVMILRKYSEIIVELTFEVANLCSQQGERLLKKNREGMSDLEQTIFNFLSPSKAK